MEAGAALYLAAKKGDAARVRALFVSGADLHAKPVRPLLRAAASPLVSVHAGGRPQFRALRSR
jgi:hypothetical protein